MLVGRFSEVDDVHKLRESSSNTIFAFLTVHSEEVFINACLEAGALGYVQEPCMKRYLVHAIQAALAGHPYVSLINSNQLGNRAE
jgi:DNA-binding NarL/FixJ family response regulator